MFSDGLRIDCVFHISRRRKDYRSKMGKLFLKDDIQKYPATKDTDNMSLLWMLIMNFLQHKTICPKEHASVVLLDFTYMNDIDLLLRHSIIIYPDINLS